jgi:hypothetical protein
LNPRASSSSSSAEKNAASLGLTATKIAIKLGINGALM